MQGANPHVLPQFLFILSIIVYVGLVIVGVYCLILFIKLAKRGIKALDIYIEDKTNNSFKNH